MEEETSTRQYADRSIRNIPIPVHIRKHIYEQPDHISQEVSNIVPSKKVSLASRIASGIIVIILFFSIGFVFSNHNEQATITIKQHVVMIETPELIEVSSDEKQDIYYKIIEFSGTASTTVPATGTKQVSRKAHGTITVLNNHSGTPQVLVKNTRFASADGHVYRSEKPVTVPGLTKKTDGTVVPGQVKVAVTADKSGADYNIDSSTNLNIPGFSGSPRFSKFSAYPETALFGGFEGTESVVTEQDSAQAKETLRKSLESQILKSTITLTPAGYLSLPGSIDAKVSELIHAAGDTEKSVVLSQNISGSFMIVENAALARRLLSNTYEAQITDHAIILNPETLIINTGFATSSLKKTKDIRLQITGPVSIGYAYNKETLANLMAGKPKSDFKTIMSQYSVAIENANADIRPVWTNTFPKDSRNIQVVEVSE